jgi:hypothetical protein
MRDATRMSLIETGCIVGAALSGAFMIERPAVAIAYVGGIFVGWFTSLALRT